MAKKYNLNEDKNIGYIAKWEAFQVRMQMAWLAFGACFVPGLVVGFVIPAPIKVGLSIIAFGFVAGVVAGIAVVCHKS